MKPILEIQDISKKFKIQHETVPYLSMRDSLLSLFKKRSETYEEFYALKNVSFEVNAGDTIGVIGKNGAGKSTLLKILSKITPPSTGRIVSRGRMASLLEVGTGFHQELSGRENIYLNGSILGMKRAEINSNFDAIVDFSGVERFLDTPLKHYSSGMQLRLAFAVAAFLENEILVIDEVLAVGDSEFQKKCLGKMEDVTKNQGRTVLFVSHNLMQVQSLCKKGILLTKGNVDFIGSSDKAIAEYLNGKENNNNFFSTIDLPRGGKGDDGFMLESIEVMGLERACIYEGDELHVRIKYSNTKPFNEVLIGVTVSDEFNTLIECRSSSNFYNYHLKEAGSNYINAKFKVNLRSGSYSVNLGARSSKGLLEYIPSVFRLEILPKPDDREDWKKESAGLVITSSEWSF